MNSRQKLMKCCCLLNVGKQANRAYPSTHHKQIVPVQPGGRGQAGLSDWSLLLFIPFLLVTLRFLVWSLSFLKSSGRLTCRQQGRHQNLGLCVVPVQRGTGPCDVPGAVCSRGRRRCRPAVPRRSSSTESCFPSHSLNIEFLFGPTEPGTPRSSDPL